MHPREIPRIRGPPRPPDTLQSQYRPELPEQWLAAGEWAVSPN